MPTNILNRMRPSSSPEPAADPQLSASALPMVRLMSEDQPTTALRVVLAHRQAILREGTRRILETQLGFEVLAETVGLTTAIPIVESLHPDVLILGLDPAELESRSFIRLLRTVLTSTRILVLDFGASAHRLARLGVTGWMSATASSTELIAGVRAVAEGRRPEGNDAPDVPEEEPVAGHPTRRELEVLALVEQGLPTRAIADRLQTTQRTVHFHVSNLFAKLGARSRTEMVHLARRQGWLE